MIYSVEDDAAIRELIVYALRQAGYEAEGFEEGGAFRQALERKTPELVLLDLMLPGLTGEEFIAKVRQHGTMPIIVLSAKAGVEDRVKVLRLGADDFIPKPFDNQEVLARVEAQLRRYKQFSGGGGSAVLTHGDLTLDREKVGDLLVGDGRCDVLALEEVADFLVFHMEQAGRVKLKCSPLPLDRLEPRERHIISLRFGLDGAREQTQKEVADRLGISQSYISRLEKRIIARLKKEIVRMM